MTEEQIQEELRRGDDNIYWCGYRRGLLLARHGRRTSSDTEHFAWLELRRRDEPILSALARGYTDAMQTVIDGRPDTPSSDPTRLFIART